ncbi:MAG: hypothetical protein MJ173_00740 [Clostridia bacterium]|nr:hypothetical protein [Clostridia bacterium]
MNNKNNENKKMAKQLTDEEIETVTGGMKVDVEAAAEEELSWWKTIINFIFKIKS